MFGIVGRDGGYTKQVADACVLIPTVSPDRITPHTEGFCAVIWHLLVSHPKLAQTLARHSTINLTMSTYTHVNMEEKSNAVGSLNATAWKVAPNDGVGEKHRTPETAEVSVLEPSGVPNGVTLGATSGSQEAPSGTSAGQVSVANHDLPGDHNPIADERLYLTWQPVTRIGTEANRCSEILHPAGLEPATFGSVVLEPKSP